MGPIEEPGLHEPELDLEESNEDGEGLPDPSEVLLVEVKEQMVQDNVFDEDTASPQFLTKVHKEGVGVRQKYTPCMPK